MSKENSSFISACFRTEDAESRDDEEGKFVFKMHTDRNKVKASKVLLGSLEFPIVQYSIENTWNRLYFCEGIQTEEWSRNFKMEENILVGTNTSTKVVDIKLPLHMQKIKKAVIKRRKTLIHLPFEHGLWVDNQSIIHFLERENIYPRLFHSNGTCVLTEENTKYVSPTCISVKGSLTPSHLHVDVFVSPSSLCNLLNNILKKTSFGVDYTLTFDNKEGRCLMDVQNLGKQKKTVTITGDALSSRLGFGTITRAFEKGTTEITGIVGYSHDPGVMQSQTIKASVFGGADFVELPEGWYSPSHRPMATGQPLKIPSEIDKIFNRFAVMPSKEAKCIVFKKQNGEPQVRKLMSGFYDVFGLCAEIEAKMNFECKNERYEFRYISEEFTVSAFDKNGDPCRINLLFTHPLSIEAERFGFEKVDYSGCCSYTSNKVHVPNMQWPRGKTPFRACRNTYSIFECSHSKRIRIENNTKPSLIGKILDYKCSQQTLILQTFLAGQAFASGMQEGDVVNLFWVYDNQVEEDSAPTFTKEKTICALVHRSCQDKITVHVEQEPWDAVKGKVIGIDFPSRPFNLYFMKSLHANITGKRLGFPNSVVQCGVDGMVKSLLRDRIYRTGPFLAPSVHSLDHPDYILMYIDEGKKSTCLQHRGGDNVTHPFAKIVLYPLFREERMLPKEISLNSGESFTVFSVRFTNPDNTPYKFHGADFSFTLNFVL